MTLGQRIQEHRKGIHLTQEGLGEALGVSRQAVSKWESDGGVPELTALIAMSKLFGVPVGVLLGVEEPSGKTDPADDSRLEAIMEKYAALFKEMQPQPLSPSEEPEKPGFRRWWLIPIGLVAALFILLSIQLGELEDDLGRLEISVGNLEYRTSQLNNDIGRVYSDVMALIESRDSLVDSFDYTLERIDMDQGTVELKLTAQLKTWSAGTTIQFLLDHDGGRVVTEAASGPDFGVNAELPIGSTVKVRVRITGADGTIQEQELDQRIPLTEDNFALAGYNLFGLYPITVVIPGSGMSTSTSGSWDGHGASIQSGLPQLVWPVRAIISLDGPEGNIDTQELTLKEDSDLSTWYCFGTTREQRFTQPTAIYATLAVMDNLGRTHTFREMIVIDGQGEIDHGIPGEDHYIWEEEFPWDAWTNPSDDV